MNPKLQRSEDRLSFAAQGLLACLVRIPKGLHVRVDDLEKTSVNKSEVRPALKELQEIGFATVEGEIAYANP